MDQVRADATASGLSNRLQNCWTTTPFTVPVPSQLRRPRSHDLHITPPNVPRFPPFQRPPELNHSKVSLYTTVLLHCGPIRSAWALPTPLRPLIVCLVVRAPNLLRTYFAAFQTSHASSAFHQPPSTVIRVIRPWNRSITLLFTWLGALVDYPDSPLGCVVGNLRLVTHIDELSPLEGWAE
ncbi:hypothetical protein V2G26_014472 [Clonostachys chloroleuca]